MSKADMFYGVSFLAVMVLLYFVILGEFKG